jgi:hypothetical protein
MYNTIFSNVFPHPHPITVGGGESVGPRPSFLETLVVFDHFWDFDKLVEDGAPRRGRDCVISPFLQDFWVLGFM